MRVGFAGCAAVTRTKAEAGPTCELGEERILRLALPEEAGDVTVEAEPGGRLQRQGDAGAVGAPMPVRVPADATRIVVRARLGGAQRAGRFELDVGSASTPPWLDAARAARAKGDHAGAIAALATHEGDARAASLRARIELAEGRADEAFPVFRNAIAAHGAAGRVGDAADDSFALAFALHQRSHRYEEARATLDAVLPLLEVYPEGAAREPYYRGVLAAEVGDHRAASALLQEAERRARALGLTKLERNARAALALEVLALGRVREALDLLRALERDAEVKGCERAEIANDIGWAALSGESDDETLSGAKRSLEAAASATACKDSYVTSFALANLARLALDAGRIDEAKQHLREARTRVREPRGTERLAWLDLDARIALASGRAREALALFDEELALANALLLLEAAERAEVGRAEALDALGQSGSAARSLERAETLLERASLLVPLGGGREGFLGARDLGARLAIDLLVRAGRVDDAARVARRSRGRLLAPVARARAIEHLPPAERAAWERAVTAYRAAREALDKEAARDWSLPASELLRATSARHQRERSAHEALERAITELQSKGASVAEPHRVPPGDLEVLVHPTRRGWVALVVDELRATAHPLGPPDAEESRRGLAEAIATRLGRSTRVRVLAYGAYRGVDVHALASAATKGAPLLELAAVDYPLGLRDGGTRRGDATTALVVGDPSQDLPHARREAGVASRALVARGRSVITLLGGEVSAARLASELPRAAWVHYAGHAAFGGEEGIESALPLADGGRFAVGDLLALARAPRTVVLSACEAGRSSGRAEGLGLAQAFVVAGAEEVLAPVRPVADDVALALATAAYEATADAGPGPDTETFAQAARRAMLRLRVERPGADWSAYRVLAR